MAEQDLKRTRIEHAENTEIKLDESLTTTPPPTSETTASFKVIVVKTRPTVHKKSGNTVIEAVLPDPDRAKTPRRNFRSIRIERKPQKLEFWD